MSKRTILIADDDQEVLDLLQELLQKEGYRILLALNGKEAVEAAQNTQLDMAILDLAMPIMGGLEALKKIKEIDQSVAALIVTGCGDVETLKQTMGEYGALDYLLKPFQKAEIIQTVSSALLKRDYLMQKKRLKKELHDRIVQLEKDFEQRTLELRESQLKYKQIAENSNDAIVVAQDGMLKFVNPKALELTGYTEEEILNIPFVNLIHPEDRDMVEERHLKRLNGEDFPSTYTFRALRKDGESFWIEINAARTMWEGRPATLNCVRDVTAQKQAQEALCESEERYKALFDRTLFCVYLHDFEGRFLDANDAALNLLGYTREEIPSLSFASLIGEDQVSKASKAVEEIKRTGFLEGMIEFKLRKRDGAYVFVEAEASLIYKNGKPFAIQSIARDVTERKRAEEALRESQEKYRSLVEISPNAILLHCDRIITYANPTAVKMFKSSALEDLVGKPYLELIHPEDRAGSEARFSMVGEEGGYAPMREHRVITRDDQVIHVESTGTSFRHKGKITVQSIFHDITERKRAEEALWESEKKHRTLVENLPVAVYRDTPGPEGKFLMANPAFLKMFGFDTLEELQEVSPANLYVNAEERKAFSDRLLEEGSVSDVELQLRRKDGAPVWGAVTARVGSKQGGESAYFDCIIVDITDRKRAEEALEESEERARALLNTITETAILIDAQGTVLASNETVAKRFGKSLDELVGIRVYDLFPPELAEARKEAADHVFRTGEPLRTTDEREGRVYDIHWYPILDAQGEVAQLAVFASDITEKRKLEEERSKAEKLESIGILAGGIAHDFNNILTAIMGNISLAKLDLDRRDRIFELLEEAETASSRAQALTRQLLTFSKGGAPVRKAASVYEVIKESSAFALRGSKTRCDFSLPDSLWPADIDVGQINQVIHNLILNSDQAMPKGGLIQVRAGNVVVEPAHGLPLKPGRYVEISVQDQGTGILEEHLSKVFDPYFTTKHKGSGLGLATAYAIIKRHDGHIAVESELGIGATFHIYLPASERETPEIEQEREKPVLGKGKILVMDDEGMIRNVAKQMLSRIGYETVVASDGAEAIELYKKAKELGEPFEAVILDLTVPGGMGGKDAVKLLKQIDPEVKGIVSSGYHNDPIMSHFKDYGFSGVVAKPYAIEELSEILNEAVEAKINKS